MRFSSVFTLLCCLAALVLSFLCLFAGSTTTFLQNADLLTLNVSRLGYTEAFNTTDGDGGFFDNIINNIEGDLNDVINGATTNIAEALNLTDFYSVHLMNYCQGYYEPNVTANNPSKNTTWCSAREALFHFDPTRAVEQALPVQISLQDIRWPQQIEDASRAIRIASTVMFVFYVIGIAFTGLAVFGALAGIFTSGRLSALGNIFLDVLGFLALGIASAIATVIMVKAVDAINQYGGEIGLAATKGIAFLGMTWGATAAMSLAVFMSIAQFIVGRRHKRSLSEKT